MLQVTGIKETAGLGLKALKAAGFINTAETVRCLHCSARYLLLIGPMAAGNSTINILDLGKGIKELTDKVTAEHASGHSSMQIIIDREFELTSNCAQCRPS